MDIPRKVYLAGAMEHNTDGFSWWDDVTELFSAEGFEALDPTKGQQHLEDKIKEALATHNSKDTIHYKAAVSDIVDKDFLMICDGLGTFVRYCEGVRRGAGAHGEITLHRAMRLPIVVWTNGYDKEQIPGWVYGCTPYIIEDKEAAIHALIDLINENMSSPTYMITLAIQEMVKRLVNHEQG